VLFLVFFTSIFGRSLFPESFNSVGVGKCSTSILNQGRCGSCWAFSATGALTDRYCIYSGNLTDTSNLVLSPQPLISCSNITGNGYDNACGGGAMVVAWNFLAQSGTTTCASDCKAGCSPYKSANCQNDPKHNGCFPCTSTCSSGMPSRYFSPNYGRIMSVNGMMQAIQADGPVQTCFGVYENFHSYNIGNPKAIYTAASGAFLGNHCVRITGWATNPQGMSYWIVANSWGRTWGDKGWFYVKSGSNVANFESYIYAGCPAGKRCYGKAKDSQETTDQAHGGKWVDVDVNSATVRSASSFLLSNSVVHSHIISAQTQIVEGIHIKLNFAKDNNELFEVLLFKDFDLTHQIISLIKK